MSHIINPFRFGGAAFSPDDISGLQLWLDADAITGLVDADPVATWEDLSSEGNDFTEATNRPTYKTNIQNGLPVVRFDGVNDVLSNVGGGVLGATAEPFSIFVVAIPRGTLSAYDPIYISRHITSGVRLCTLISTKWGTFGGSNKEATSSLSAGTPYLLSMIAAGAGGGAFRLNEASDGTWTGTQYGAAASDYIGAEPGVSRFVEVDVCEIIIYDSELAGGDITGVETYLASKWAT